MASSKQKQSSEVFRHLNHVSVISILHLNCLTVCIRDVYIRGTRNLDFYLTYSINTKHNVIALVTSSRSCYFL